MESSIRLTVVDGSRLFRDALAAVVDRQRDLHFVDPGDWRSAAAETADAVDVVLVDASRQLAAAEERVHELHRRLPRAKLIVIGLDRADTDVVRLIEAGAAGYVHGEQSLDELLGTVRAVIRGEATCSDEVARCVFQRLAELSSRRPAATTPLTARQREILRLIAEGHSNKEIARRLGIALYTAKNHVHNILDKLAVRSRGAAIRLGHEMGLLRHDWLDGADLRAPRTGPEGPSAH